jgi:hypothetical protein
MALLAMNQGFQGDLAWLSEIYSSNFFRLYKRLSKFWDVKLSLQRQHENYRNKTPIILNSCDLGGMNKKIY